MLTAPRRARPPRQKLPMAIIAAMMIVASTVFSAIALKRGSLSIFRGESRVVSIPYWAGRGLAARARPLQPAYAFPVFQALAPAWTAALAPPGSPVASV